MTKKARANLLFEAHRTARTKNAATPAGPAKERNKTSIERSPLIETYLVRRLANIKKVSEHRIYIQLPLDKQNIKQRHRLRLVNDIRRDFGIVLDAKSLKPDETISTLAGRLVSSLLANSKCH